MHVRYLLTLLLSALLALAACTGNTSDVYQYANQPAPPSLSATDAPSGGALREAQDAYTAIAAELNPVLCAFQKDVSKWGATTTRKQMSAEVRQVSGALMRAMQQLNETPWPQDLEGLARDTARDSAAWAAALRVLPLADSADLDRALSELAAVQAQFATSASAMRAELGLPQPASTCD